MLLFRLKKHTSENVADTTFKQTKYPFKVFKGCLPQILLGPLLNTLSHIIYNRTHVIRTSVIGKIIVE